MRRGRRHFPVRLLGCQRLQGVECPDLPAEGQSAAKVQTHSLTSSACPGILAVNYSLRHRAHSAVPPPLAGWWASSGSTVSVGPSCVSCAGPPAPRPPWSDCCSTTAPGLSSGTCSWPTGRRRVRLLGERFALLHVNNPPRHTYTEAATIMYRQIRKRKTCRNISIPNLF